MLSIHGHRGQHTLDLHRAVQEAVYHYRQREEVPVLNGDLSVLLERARQMRARCPTEREDRGWVEVQVARRMVLGGEYEQA